MPACYECDKLFFAVRNTNRDGELICSTCADALNRTDSKEDGY